MKRKKIQLGTSAETPFEWNELVYLVREGKLDHLGREKAAQMRYDEWSAGIRRKWKTVGDFVRCERLGCQSETDMETGLLVSRGGVTGSPRVLDNDFPYWVVPPIWHGVLWSQTPIDGDVVRSTLPATLGHPQWVEWDDFIFFRNPTVRQSISEIWHIQIFCKTKP